uniref:Uncharacterized protein n=1 Tax=Tanacetum cinerariifolium TaxID=118510 RepID=A0A6L2K8G0_TANCI|nr:hypothetical protein [Tanacetum cinerariifolium]
MASFDYCLNPLYPIKECSSCGALYTMDHCCSEGSLGDKIICDLDKTPDLSQLTPHNCPKCKNPVDGQYCQGCALLRKKFKEDLFTYCIENTILRDFSEPSNDNTNIVNALQEPFVVKQNPGVWFKKDCISSVTTWEDLVEKFIKKFYQLSYDNKEIEAEEDDDPNDIADIFKIKGNLFDYETPLCKAFNDLNYLIKI